MTSNGEKRSYPKIGGENGAPSRKMLKGVATFCCPEGYDPVVWQARVDLAACYQVKAGWCMMEAALHSPSARHHCALTICGCCAAAGRDGPQ